MEEPVKKCCIFWVFSKLVERDQKPPCWPLVFGLIGFGGRVDRYFLSQIMIHSLSRFQER